MCGKVLHVWVLAAVSWYHVTAEMSSDFIASEASRRFQAKWLSLAHLHSFPSPGFPSFCLPLSLKPFYPLKSQPHCSSLLLTISLWYLDPPLFDSSNGGKGENQPILVSFQVRLSGMSTPAPGKWLEKKKKKHFLSHFCLLRLSAFVYLSFADD